jgi:chorismate synthase
VSNLVAIADRRDLSFPGRVAAGAIAEHYLRQAYGIEIVAFVSSVGKIHLPDSLAPPSLTALKGGEDDDEVEDALSPEFRKLLATITREEVDRYPTRCPHQETSEKMTQVVHFQIGSPVGFL